jgi:hypothetical protein
VFLGKDLPLHKDALLFRHSAVYQMPAALSPHSRKTRSISFRTTPVRGLKRHNEVGRHEINLQSSLPTSRWGRAPGRITVAFLVRERIPSTVVMATTVSKMRDVRELSILLGRQSNVAS